MADRLFIEDDNSPTQSDIVLEPEYLKFGHVRLIENVKIYENLVSYLFHEIQSNNEKMNNLDDIVYDMLNKSKFNDLDISSSEIDLGNPNRPYYSEEDYREYIKKFLEVMEAQNLVSLIADLKSRNILTDVELISKSTKERMQDIKFRVKDLSNKSRVDRVVNYTLEPEDSDNSTLDSFLSGKPMMDSSLEDYVSIGDKLTFDSDKYIQKMLVDANLMSRKKNSEGKLLFTLKSGKRTIISGKENKKVTGKSGIIHAMRVEVNEAGDDSYVFYGLGEDKSFTSLDEAKTHWDAIDSVTVKSLDLNKPITNPLKDSIMSFITPDGGKLKTGELSITFKKAKLSDNDISAILGDAPSSEIKDSATDLLEAVRDRKKVLAAQESIRDKANASISIGENDTLIIESDEGDEDVVNIDSERDVLEDIIEMYGASFIDASINKEGQEFITWYKTPKKRMVSARKKDAGEDETNPLGRKEISDAGKLKITSNVFPVIKITELEKTYKTQYDFNVNKTFLSPERRSRKIIESGGKKLITSDEGDSKGEYQMKDIGIINRLKATYRNLERMVDRF